MELDLIENSLFISKWQIWSKCNNFLGVDMSSSAHIDNKKKDILDLEKGLTQRIKTYFNCRKNVLN